VSGWTGIQQVAAGFVHTVGLKTDGTVVAVGYNSDGQCDVSGWTGIQQVAAGYHHTIGLKTDGTVVAVGDNTFGQCKADFWDLGVFNKNSTTISVISSQNPSTHGQPVSFTGVVSPVPPATGTPTGAVQFKIDGSDFGSPVALSGGSATSDATSTLAAGSYTVSAVYSGEANFDSSTSSPLTQTVNKAAATVTLSNLSHTYDGTPKSATAATTAPPGLTVTITYDGSATPPANAGSYAVVATVTDANYQGTASGTLVIAKANQAITLGALGNKTYGDPDFTVSATASSGLTVSFTASGACTVSGNTVHITGVGSCNITAHQAGNGNYNAAPDVSRTFAVNITYERLGDLVKQSFTNQGIVNSLLAKLDNAQKAEARGNANAKAGMISAFINEVEAQIGKAISAENAAILISLARAL